MKLKFSIPYHTAWGESLHVVVAYRSEDGTVRHHNLTMLTDDGQLWTVETAALESRQHPVSEISYCYQVEDAEGRVLRREWDLVARRYHFDASKDYWFPDLWRERPLCSHLYTAAYDTMVRGAWSVERGAWSVERGALSVERGALSVERGAGSVERGALSVERGAWSVERGAGSVERGAWSVEREALRLPLFRQTIVFRVAAPQLKPGQSLAVCGSHPALGSWNPQRYQRMEYAGQHVWMLSVNALGMLPPIEYKYVVTDSATHDLVAWEEGENRVIDFPRYEVRGARYENTQDAGNGEGVQGNLAPRTSQPAPREGSFSILHSPFPEGTVLVLDGDQLRVREDEWRAAGVVVPVFALRSEQSYGVGDFGDLKRMVEWAARTGMKVIQILPVNDTTLSHGWTDSYPYNIVSAFALHPHYIDLEQLGALRSKGRMTAYHRQRRELNALAYSDYEAVERVKRAYVEEWFAERGPAVLESAGCKDFVARNADWLEPYAAFCEEHSAQPRALTTVVQYVLHVQLKAAADEARRQGIVLKGDLPIGVCRQSVETLAHPGLFRLDMQTGAPPDAFAANGQNWGFPTYRWENGELTAWFRRRFAHMEQYFDALRIDHVLGFFRIWEIPEDAVHGVLGHFSPALPLTVGEIEYFGLPFRRDFMTRPFINDRIIDRLFGIHAQYVREHFLMGKAYGLYDLKPDFSTQRQVQRYFGAKTDEHSVWIRDGLYRLIANVLFVEDPRQPEMYHPRIGAWQDLVFETLSAEEKDAYMRLYNNYYYQRHSMYWGAQAMKRLPDILRDTRMLICAEDLGMLPDCVAPVLDALRILSLEIQALPKQQGTEFGHLDANPKRSVATISTHDMPSLRLWWEESPERAQRYYITMLQKEGRAPQHLPAHLAEEIVARHLYCPSMLCLLSLQDWLSMDGELRGKDVRAERINVPSDPYNRWQYRMPMTIEQLLAATRYNNKVKTMIQRSRR